MAIGSRAINYFITANLVGFNRAIRKADDDVDGFVGGLGKATESVAVLAGALIGVGLITAKMAKSSVDSFRPFRDEIALAAIASKGGIESIGGLQERALGLTRTMKRLPLEMAETTRAISFFGLESAKSEVALSQVATQLEELGGTKAEKGAKTITTLLRSVGGEDAINPERIRALAGAIFSVGTSITSDIGGLQNFLEIFQVMGVTSKLNEVEIVALSGAIADLNEKQREIATTAAIRTFTSENFTEFGKALGLSVDEVKRFRKEDPIGFFTAVAARLKRAGDEDEFIGLMKELNIGEARSARGLSSLIANLDRLQGPNGLLSLVGDDVANVTNLNDAFNDKMKEGTGPLRNFQSSVGTLGVRIGGVLTPAFNGLLTVLTKLVDLLNSPGGALLATVGGGAASALVTRKLIRSLMKNGAIAGAVGAGKSAVGGLLEKGAGFLGRGAVGRAAMTMGRGVLRGPVGMILTAVTVLAPVFQSISTMLDAAAENGGKFAIVIKVVSTAFKLIAAVGNTIGLVFRAIHRVISWFVGGLVDLAKSMGLGWFVSKIENGLDRFNGGLDAYNSQVSGALRNNPGGPSGISGPVDRGDVTVNVNSPTQDATVNYVQRALALGGRV